jgi:hypothetical protein
MLLHGCIGSLFDVDVLLALSQPDHVHFERAQEWACMNRRAVAPRTCTLRELDGAAR